MSRFLNLIFAGSYALLVTPAITASAQGAGSRFCVVPVKDGAPTAADVWQTWRISKDSFQIPGLPALVLTPTNRRGQWTISADRRLVSYSGPYPHSYLDKNNWVREPWSSRIVAVTHRGGVSVLRPGADHFDLLAPGHNADGRYVGFGSIQVLPRRQMTVVLVRGVPFVVGETALRPWLSRSDLAAHGIRGMSKIYDAPPLAATIVIDTDSELHVLTDDDRWFHVGNVSKDDYGRVFAARDAGGAVFLGQKSVVFIRQSSVSPAGYSAERILTTTANGAAFRYSTSELFHQFLTFDSGGPLDWRKRWRRLTPTGFEDIPGGDTGVSDPNFDRFGQFRDLPTLGKALIHGADGLFLYDGFTIRAVEHSSEKRLGRLPRAYDLPSIRKVLIVSQKGLFELTADGHLIERPMIFPADGLPPVALVDWPDSNVALALSRDGLFALDVNLKAHQVRHGEAIKLGWLPFANGTNPATGEMVLTNVTGLFLAADARRSPDICPPITP